jgi:hypothetical protein
VVYNESMAQRRSLFRYYADQKWADAFLDGRFRFWSLAYFRDLEEKGVRGDENEGTTLFRPEGGLQITNRTQGTTFTMPTHAMTSAARQDEILVFCASRSFSASLWEEFGASVCVEITDIPAFCARVRAGLPREARSPGRPGRERLGQRVEYYRVSDAPDTRWALPGRIASSKLADYSRQDEFRLVFSVTGALAFQNVSMKLVPEGAEADTPITGHGFHDVDVGSLLDICVVHKTKPSI